MSTSLEPQTSGKKAIRAASSSALPKPPQGAIKTANPKGQSFGLDWSAINQYDELIARAGVEFSVPFGRIKALIPIESGGDKRAVQKNNTNGWSYGLGQIVPFTADPIRQGWEGHHKAVKQIAGLPANASRDAVVNALYDPEINLRVTAKILRGYYDQFGTWDAANSGFFTGKSNWAGADSVNGTQGGDYKRSLNGLLSEIWAADTTEHPDEGEYHFGFPSWPKGFDRRILTKPPSGNGWDALGSRTAGMCATVSHITDGYDNRDSIFALFNIGGGRAYDAATDSVIDRAGLGYLMLDPWSVDPMQGSGMTPWASGGNKATGPGVAFLQTLGGYAHNKYGFSTEHCNRDGQFFTDPQMNLSAKVHAVTITRMEIPWDTFPINPKVNGLYVALKHRDFTTQKSCPGRVWDQSFHNIWIQTVAAEAKLLQTGSGPSVPIPIPDPDPAPDPLSFTKYGLKLDQISDYFGTLKRHNADGTIDALPFDPDGVISNLWIDRFGDVGIFPEAQEMKSYDSSLATGREWFASFEGGYTAWLPLDNNKAFWKWLDEPESLT